MIRMCAAACVFLALLSTSEGRALELSTCPKIVPFFTSVHKYGNERVSKIFIEVARIADLKDRRFALCESNEFSPATFLIPESDGRGFAIVIPAAIAEFPEPVIRGIFAHELGHLLTTDLIGRTAELRADQQAVAWVGKDAVVDSLRAMRTNIHRFPKWQQDLGRTVLDYRIKALLEDMP